MSESAQSIVVYGPDGPLEQQLSLQSRDGSTVVTLESAGGGRNPDYNDALDAILRRAKADHWSLDAVYLVSQRVQKLPPNERLIIPDGPVDLDDPYETRRAIQRTVALAHRKEGAKGGGNPQKRIELVFSTNTDDDAALELAITPEPTATAPPASYHVDVGINVKNGKPRFPNGRALQQSWRLHNQTQMLLVRRIANTQSTETVKVKANVDVAWKTAGIPGVTIAEVKSLTASNEDSQLRMAIGEILHFAELVGQKHKQVTKVIFVPWQPRKKVYDVVCSRAGIQLSWPGNWPDHL